MKDIINFYNNYDEEGRLLRKSRRPEYITTMRYIEKYLTPDSKIIEIGAGTGRYSITLADKGYDVTAVELVPHNIEIMEKKLKPEHNIKIFEGNACDLSFIESEAYDIVLLLGPMYHLFTDEDKHRAISEALRIAKKNAVVFVSYCNNDTSVYKFFLKGVINIYDDKLDETYHTASIPNEVFELYRKEDIDRIMQQHNVKRLHYIGTDLLTPFFTEHFDDMSNENFEKYMKYHFVLCERPDMHGFSFHLLDVFRKN